VIACVVLFGDQAGAVPAERGAREQIDVHRRLAREHAGGHEPGPRRGERPKKGVGSHFPTPLRLDL
jgi:hypothetical protein